MADPKENPFKKFGTMTYSVSLYLLSLKDYNDIVLNQNKDVSKLQLLIQSGGAHSDETRAALGIGGAKRNRHFPNDFYIDDLRIDSYISGTATGGPTNAFEAKFTVTEPMGITFIERLYNASTEFNREQGIKDFNPLMQLYLMVVRFYGYDEKGNQITNGNFEQSSDPNAYTEKWIPLMFHSIGFTVETGQVVYECEAVSPHLQIGHGRAHGTVPFGISLQGNTLGDLLDGTSKAPTKGGIVSRGLMDALRKHQVNRKKESGHDFADQYYVEFKDDEIKRAVLGETGTTAIARTGMSGEARSEDISELSYGDATADKKNYQHALEPGIKIAKALDIAIRSSSYISSQYNKTNDVNKDGTTVYTQKDPNILKWFKINPRVEIIDFDTVRQEWAYKITYVISRYDVRSVNTKDFDNKDCFDLQKEYNYWFTGQNTEVLGFKQVYNHFYAVTFSGKDKAIPGKNPRQQVNLNAMKQFRPNSTQVGASENLTDEQAANAASVLYSPGEIGSCDIEIIGDPDWIGQSEIFFTAKADGSKDVRLEDGSINYDIGEIFFSVNFNTVVDYSLRTGLADTTQKNYFLNNNPSASPGGSFAQYRFLYRANMIVSQFQQGKFVQELQGTIVWIPEECIIDKKQSKEAREEPSIKTATGKGDALKVVEDSIKGRTG